MIGSLDGSIGRSKDRWQRRSLDLYIDGLVNR